MDIVFPSVTQDSTVLTPFLDGGRMRDYFGYQEQLAMLSREEVAKIRGEIERLEKLRENCNDGGIKKSIDSWIEEQKKKLSEDKPK
jgi:hypothetical protein